MSLGQSDTAIWLSQMAVGQKEAVETMALIAVGMINLAGVLFFTHSKQASEALVFPLG
jgi:hypothetical protein